MQHANDPDAVEPAAVQDDVAYIVDPEKPRADVIAGPADRMAIGKLLPSSLEPADVLGRLNDVPLADGESRDFVNVGFGPKRVPVLGHARSTRRRKAVLRPYPVEEARLGVRACVALRDRRAQLGQLSLLAALFLLQRFLARAQHVLDASEAPGSYLGLGETREIGRKVSGRDGLPHRTFPQ
jgi:hypothetical protein